MTYTNFPNGLTSFGVPVNGAFTNGNVWFVKPGTSAGGSDGFTGTTPQDPLATMKRALALATADNNDVIYQIASSNTLALTTDALTSTLAWNKDSVHWIGLNCRNAVSQRSRVGVATTATGASVAPLVTFSANDCYTANIQFISELASADAIGCVNVTGMHNHFVNCHFGGAATTTQDVAGAYSLRVSGSENLFENCTIGIDTITRATATYEMYMAGAATRNIFRNCLITTYAGHNTMTFLTTAGTLDRYTLFDNCTFVNAVGSAATTMTGAFSIGSTGGAVVLKNCMIVGAANTEGTASGFLYHDPMVTAVAAVTTKI